MVTLSETRTVDGLCRKQKLTAGLRIVYALVFARPDNAHNISALETGLPILVPAHRNNVSRCERLVRHHAPGIHQWCQGHFCTEC